MRKKKQLTLSPEALKEAAECLRMLAHPQRLQIVQLLSCSQLSVGEIAETCGIAHNLASTHLKALERCRLLSSERKGRQVFYSLADAHLEEFLRCIEKRFA